MSFLAELAGRKDLRLSGVKKQQSDGDPSLVTTEPWVYESDPSRQELPSGGKWLVFRERGKELLAVWQNLQELYRKGALEGVESMKCSTGSGHQIGPFAVIVVYCGPPTDRDRCLAIGRGLLAVTGDATLHYKTDMATARGIDEVLYSVAQPEGVG